MNNKILPVATLVGALMCGSTVYAQTCASPLAFNTPESGPTASGTTCGATDEVAAYCIFQDSVGKPDIIYTVHLAAEGTPERTATEITVSGGAGGFTPTLYLYSDACATANACAETGTPTGALDLTGIGAGDYLLAVSALQTEASGACGPFTATANGSLPVDLKSFSVL